MARLIDDIRADGRIACPPFVTDDRVGETNESPVFAFMPGHFGAYVLQCALEFTGKLGKCDVQGRQQFIDSFKRRGMHPLFQSSHRRRQEDLPDSGADQ
jgi:hypothetical protein